MVVNPNAPIGAGWFTPTGGWTPQPSYAGSPYGSQPGGATSMSDVDKWNAYLAKIEAAINEANAENRRWDAQRLKAQYEDAQKGRDNALAVANLNNQTSRYGYDLTRQSQIEELKEKARQFDASHGMELQKLGLQRAQTATEYLSSPDRFVQASDFLDLSGRIVGGGTGYAGASGTPQMKTMSDYAALESGGNPGRQVGAASVGGNPNDPRVKALKAVIEASPPSSEPGMDNNGWAVLNAAKSIYSMNLTPQQQALISGDKQYQQMLGSAGKRLGQNPESWMQRQRQSLPGQQSSRAA